MCLLIHQDEKARLGQEPEKPSPLCLGKSLELSGVKNRGAVGDVLVVVDWTSGGMISKYLSLCEKNTSIFLSKGGSCYLQEPEDLHFVCIIYISI